MIRPVAAALAVFALTGATPPRPAVELALRPVLDSAGFAAMDVAVSFDGDPDGETVVDLPDDWGGESDLWRHVSDLRAEGGDLGPGLTEAHRTVRHAPGARVTLRYRVSDASALPRNGVGNDYRPLIRPTHFHLLGNAIVALPAEVDMKAPARFRIDALPAGAAFASDLEHDDQTVLDLVESVAVGGDFRTLDAGGGLRIAIRGAWSRDDAGWRAQVARIGAAQRAYWGADDEPYLVTILPLDLPPESLSIGGTGRGDGFAFFATGNAPQDRFDQLLAHEMMHTWTPRRIGGNDEEDEQLRYWLSEGFTDWASYRTLVRGGIWGPEEFAAAFNESLAAYDLSPVRTAPNTRILADFWRSREVQRLPYQRGMLLATRWDAAVRAATGGRRDFDDVLLAMQRTAARRGDVPAHLILPVVMRRTGRTDIAMDLRTLVDEGAPVEIPADVFAPCGRIVGRDQKQWERGFDFDATRRADWTIAGVVEGSNAHAAGLRNGMQLRRWSESSSDRDPDRPVNAGVSHGGVARDITWIPASREVRAVRQLVLDPAMDRGACVRRLSGLD